MVNKWDFNQVRALKLLARRIVHEGYRKLLLKLAQIISVGTSIKEFLRLEFSRLMMSFENEYGRRMSKLKTYAEAYSSVLTSCGFVSIAMLLTSMIYGAYPPDQVLTLTIFVIVILQALTAVLICINSPLDRILHKMDHRPAEIRRIESLLKPCMIIAILILVVPNVLYVLGILDLNLIELPILRHLFPYPIFMIGSGLIMFYVGHKGRKLVSKVKELEAYFPVFIKTYGEAATVVSSSPLGIMKTIIYNDFGALNDLVKKFYKRLKMGVDPDVCWRLFRAGSGSVLISRTLEIYHKATKVGGDSREISDNITNFVSMILLLRKRREQVAGYSRGLIVPIHATIIAIFALIRSLMIVFARFVELVAPYISFLSYVPESAMNIYLFIVMMALIIGNALALHFLEGESAFSFPYYLGIFLVITGIIFYITSFGTEQLLSIFTRYGEELGELVGEEG